MDELTKSNKEYRQTLSDIATWQSLIEETKAVIMELSLSPTIEKNQIIYKLQKKIESYEFYIDREKRILKLVGEKIINVPEDIKIKAQELISKYKKIEPDVTKDLLVFENPYASLIGEVNKFKSEARLSQKITKKLNENEHNTLELVISNIKDILRYTFVIEPDNYVEETKKILKELSMKGYKIGKVSNYWDRSAKKTYNGINVPITINIDGNDYLFELQFHTLESFMVKGHLSHSSYEIRQIYEMESNLPRTRRLIDESVYKIAVEIQERLEEAIDRPRGIDTLLFDDLEYNMKAR